MSTFAKLPQDCTFIYNPSFEELDEMISRMPNAKKTKYGNWNVSTKVVSRSGPSTYMVSDTPEAHTIQTISKEEGDKMAQLQNEYMNDKEMIVIDGYIGNDPEFRVKARLIVEPSSANIAAMQKTMYYPLENYENENYEPEVTIIYTPNLEAKGYANDRLIASCVDCNVTRIFNSDYFGESKKSGLRMWNKMVYDRGGIPLHAGAKIVPTDDGEKTLLIIGLSGTGKTTTTFTSQNNSRPVQDDFLALMADGKVFATEAGCFAKTFGLNPETEEAIFNATIDNKAYLENVSMNEEGELDFFDTSYTKNGRAVFSLNAIPNAGKASEIEKASALIILNRNENIIPSVAKLNAEQAAAYFMLGETTGTSAGGAAEAGKALRIPGTNPFFPLLDDQQGNRVEELLGKVDMEVYLMNTGRVGGQESIEESKKVKIPHSSACVKGIAENTIEWEEDPDFGYMVATKVPGIEDEEIIQPKKLYERTGRIDEYNSMVEKLKAERLEYFKKYPKLDSKITSVFN
ncbi:phosphoenolpyruvate carboxykinase [Patescibacteria group bacterium]